MSILSSFATSPAGYEALCASGTVAGLAILLGFRMSMYRLAGSPGENTPNSPLNRMSEVQLLTAEWAGVGIPTMLAAALKYPDSYLVRYLCMAFAFSRIAFCGVLFTKKQKHRMFIGFPSMSTMYTSLLVLAFILAGPGVFIEKYIF